MEISYKRTYIPYEELFNMLKITNKLTVPTLLLWVINIRWEFYTSENHVKNAPLCFKNISFQLLPASVNRC